MLHYHERIHWIDQNKGPKMINIVKTMTYLKLIYYSIIFWIWLSFFFLVIFWFLSITLNFFYSSQHSLILKFTLKSTLSRSRSLSLDSLDPPLSFSTVFDKIRDDPNTIIALFLFQDPNLGVSYLSFSSEFDILSYEISFF